MVVYPVIYCSGLLLNFIIKKLIKIFWACQALLPKDYRSRKFKLGFDILCRYIKSSEFEKFFAVDTRPLKGTVCMPRVGDNTFEVVSNLTDTGADPIGHTCRHSAYSGCKNDNNQEGSRVEITAVKPYVSAKTGDDLGWTVEGTFKVKLHNSKDLSERAYTIIRWAQVSFGVFNKYWASSYLWTILFRSGRLVFWAFIIHWQAFNQRCTYIDHLRTTFTVYSGYDTYVRLSSCQPYHSLVNQNPVIPALASKDQRIPQSSITQ